MPIDPITGGLVVAGANLFGQGVNAFAQGRMNKKTRDFSREMYEKQKADNLAYWHMQNDYNSPQAMMSRFKEAGLNPNMIYGNAGNNSASNVHSATPPAWSPRAPQFDLSSPMSSYFDVAMKSAQLDNVKAINNKILMETKAIAAQAGLRESELNFSQQFFGNRAGKMGYDAQKARQSTDLQELLQNPDAVIGDNDNARSSIAYRMAYAKLQNLGIDTQIKQAISSGKSIENLMKQLEYNLSKNGINAKDPTWIRAIGTIISNYVNLSNFKF